MTKIFVTGKLSSSATTLMREEGCESQIALDQDDSETIAKKIEQFQPDGLLVRKGRIDRSALEASKRLRVVSKHGVGVDNIDVDAATELGISVLITASANYESVAEHTLAMMLALVRRIPTWHDRTRQGVWDKSAYVADELCDKTLGIIGYGRIGRRVAELVSPFRMKVLVHDPYCSPGDMTGSAQFCPDLDQLLRQADILTIHCPLTDGTRGLIGSDQLALMKPGAFLINTARGAIIDEAALIEALAERTISGAALDTFAVEPPAPDNPLFQMDNVVVTNHVAGMSNESFDRMGVDAVNNILTVLRGGKPEPACLLNPTVLAEQSL